MIINKQTEKLDLTFNLNVEINENQGFKAKNPLTMKKFDCIIITSKWNIFAMYRCPFDRGADKENRRVVYDCQRSNG